MTITTADTAGHWTIGGSRSISRMGFGAMRLPARSWTGPAVDRGAALSVLERAIELGIDHIDTAAFYFFEGQSANELIKTALHPYPDNLLIATKVGPVRGADGNGLREGTADELEAAVEQNLHQLGLDRLDLVYLRVGGIEAPNGDSIGERFEALAALRERGLIQHLGLSNVTADHLAEAQHIAPVSAIQNYFNVGKQDDATLLASCADQGIAFVPFFPLGGGHQIMPTDRMDAVAARHDATPAQIALAWLLELSPAMLAIPGTASVSHLEENVAAAAIQLTAEDRSLLT